MYGHRRNVCKIQWSPEGTQLASGGDDNLVCIWSNRCSGMPLAKLRQHTAAVKALAWSPYQSQLLASGGGTSDASIRFTNTDTICTSEAHPTGSQVCNLVWSRSSSHLISTQGYSQNLINLWDYPRMTRLASLSGHTQRVLYSARSPDGQTLVTGSGDETLQFRKVFPAHAKPQSRRFPDHTSAHLR
ncbi:hypothetical protein WJX72_001886 [[Myrmecia] bisecta]|uniref:CDC20/Fizzy WD40 domain-containing protein n=1 Tax=[Myrmecia] bisecta TaxID=41462 RepID=A0AAW1Q3G8_9CHLO